LKTILKNARLLALLLTVAALVTACGGDGQQGSNSGGDKTGRWREWYEKLFPKADQLYADHLEELRAEGELP
jgi:hypothetical protein